MKSLVAGVLAFLIAVAGFGAAAAQDLSALAKLRPGVSSIRDASGGLAVMLGLSQAVPWRVRVLDSPPRLLLDFREVDWDGIARVPHAASRLVDLRAGAFRPGWSRLVLQLDGPLLVARSEMRTGPDGAVLDLLLAPASAADFAARAKLPEPPEWAMPALATLPPPLAVESGPLVVVLDPGHGGIDPGAERGSVSEAPLMLTFARELKEALLRAGGFRVVLTRDEDEFVPLEARISIARAVGADVFLALHADALAEGEAVGTTIYTLADTASDAAAAALAERHDRDDLLSGVDLTGLDDRVAKVLMDLARAETEPRTDLLALALQHAMETTGIRMHRIPRQYASFSVLKSPDVPSALIELGFLSSERDLARLTDPAWRQKMAAAIVLGLQNWTVADAAQAELRRK